MDIQRILNQVMQDPQAQQLTSQIADHLSKSGVPEEVLQQAAQILQQVLENPQLWPKARQYAIQNGAAEEGDLPEEFHPGFVMSLLAAIMQVLGSMKTQSFAKGGLAKYTLAEARNELQRGGRGGDTILAHINPREAEALRRMGGSGTVNPNTGLREYKSKALKWIAPIAAIATNFIVPGLGMAIGGAMGLTGTAAAAAGGAVIGGATSALSGGDPLKGALLGGAGGALSSAFGGAGEAASGASGAGEAASGAGEALSGAGEALAGAGEAAAGSAPSLGLGSGFYDSLGSGMEGSLGSLGKGLADTGSQFAPELASSFGHAAAESFPSSVAPMELGSGFYNSPEIGAGGPLGSGMYSPYSAPYPTEDLNIPAAGAAVEPSAWDKVNGALKSTADFVGSPVGKLVGSLGGAAISAYDANRKNELIKEAMQNQQNELNARKAEAAKYNNPVRYAFDRQSTAPALRRGASEFFTNNALPTTVVAAKGGLMRAFAGGGYMNGGTSGQSDQVNAMLSDGEFVVPADVVAHLGDGNSEAGANRLHGLMAAVRKQKTAKRTGLPSKAMAPAKYLKGAK